MSITTNAELQTAVAAWLHRSDLTATVPDFITLAEADLNRDLASLRLLETTATLTLVANQAYAALPTDFRSPIACFIDWGTGKRQITKRDAADLAYSTAARPPNAWAIDGANVQFGAPIDSTSTYTLSLRYLANLDIANSNAAALYVLNKHTDLYLFGSLIIAADYVLTPEDKLARWQARYDRSLAHVLAKEGQSLAVETSVDPGLMTNDTYRRERIFG